MKVLDLFSGIGGFSIGLEKAGFETIAFCEVEPYCRGVLERHWPDVKIYGDVTGLTGEQLRADGLIPDVIVGGYPCQPFSVAGKQRGTEDDRHLWPEVFRLIKEIRPAWCIFENVDGHIRLGLDEVLSDLESEDYATRPFVIPAAGVDAPHRRNRVYIVSKYVGDTGISGCDRFVGGRSGQELENGCEDVSNGGGKRLQRDVGKRQTGAKGQSDGHASECSWWPAEPAIRRVAYGVPNRSHRIKALGNAVVPQIPEAIGKVIMEIVNNE